MKNDGLTFLNSNPDIDKLILWGNWDLSALPSLPNLKELYICDGQYLNLSAIRDCNRLGSLYITLDKNALDTVSSLCQLVDLSINLVDVSDLSWLNSFTDLESLSVSCNKQKKVVWPKNIAKVNKLYIDSYKPHTLVDIPLYSSLKSLRISTANLRTLDGIERFQNLETFGLSFASKLSDISALKHSLLHWIYFEYCPKIYDYGVLGEIASLSGVSLTAQKIKSIGFAKKLSALKILNISGTIEDRDLSPVLSAEYVWFDDRKFYPFRHDEPWLETKNRLCTVDWEGKEICRLEWFEKPWTMKQ